MNTSGTTLSKQLVALARMLERMESSTQAVDGEQYRAVVGRLAAQVQLLPHDAALDALLDTFPSAAELYENLNYEQAGLCRSPLESAARAEIAARQAIDAARRAPDRI
jgi:hypothetical protein